MTPSGSVKDFESVCQRLLTLAAMEEPFTDDEILMVEYYCREVLVLFQEQRLDTRIQALRSAPGVTEKAAP